MEWHISYNTSWDAEQGIILFYNTVLHVTHEKVKNSYISIYHPVLCCILYLRNMSLYLED